MPRLGGGSAHDSSFSAGANRPARTVGGWCATKISWMTPKASCERYSSSWGSMRRGYDFEAARNLPVRGSSAFGREDGKVHWEDGGEGRDVRTQGAMALVERRASSSASTGSPASNS